MKARVAFIIISYHPDKAALTTLLGVLSNQTVIVVDNGGTLKSGDIGRATLLSQSANVGYGAAANIGIHHASAHGASWFVVINQDLTITKESVSVLLKTLKTLSYCVAGPFSAGLDVKRWTTILPSDRLDYITGSCMVIHAKVIGKIGYFYEPYFLYYEDADYCVRARYAGVPLIRLELPGTDHQESASLGRGSKTHQYYLARNHLAFVRRLAPLQVKLYELARFSKTLWEHVTRRERGALYGIRDYVIGRFGQYRRKI